MSDEAYMCFAASDNEILGEHKKRQVKLSFISMLIARSTKIGINFKFRKSFNNKTLGTIFQAATTACSNLSRQHRHDCTNY